MTDQPQKPTDRPKEKRPTVTPTKEWLQQEYGLDFPKESLQRILEDEDAD